MLQRILAATDRGPQGIRPVHLDVIDLSITTVLREWENIDILCVNDQNRLAVVIENKIESGERPGQLQEYLQKTQRFYPGFGIIPIFLTPDGIEPVDENSPYIPVDYSLISETLENLLKTRRSVMGPDVFTTITHYVEMLRRHVVSDSKIAELARKIYDKHRQALDLIFEHRPDKQSEFAEKLQQLVQAEPRLELDHCSKGYIRFSPKEWDGIPELKKGQGWTRSKRLLLFEFRNPPDAPLKLHLLIGPSERGAEEIRQKLFKYSQAKPELFPPSLTKILYSKWSTIWLRAFLTGRDLEGSDGEELFEKVGHGWQRFLQHDLPPLVASVKGAFGQ